MLEFEPGSIVWLAVVIGGTAILGIAVAFAISQWRHRDRRLDPVREEATRQNYEADEREAQAAERPTAPNVPPRRTGSTPRSTAA
jgi:hypothetical protein